MSQGIQAFCTTCDTEDFFFYSVCSRALLQLKISVQRNRLRILLGVISAQKS